MWFKYGLKAQKLLAQGIAFGMMAIIKTTCKGKSFMFCFYFFPRLRYFFVRLGYRLGYFSPRLGYFFLDFVTFFSPNRDDKFLRLVIIHKCDIDVFVQSTSDAATYTSVWQAPFRG